MAADAMVSVSMGAMEPVLAKLAVLMGDGYKKIKGLRTEVTFLQRELSYMVAVLEMMDNHDKLSPQAKIWRNHIIEMSYDIEDRIDNFMHHVGEPKDNLRMLQKAYSNLKTFKASRRLLSDLQEIKTRVMEARELGMSSTFKASRRQDMYKLDGGMSSTEVVDPRIWAFYKHKTSLVGIDDQIFELVNWAMDEGKQLKFMAIVGFGGLGKTMLAKQVYSQVAGMFDCKLFVSISQKPNMIELFNSLLSQLGLGTFSHDCHEYFLMEKIRGLLQDKRYFVVLDDLWDLKAWKFIYCAFPHNNQCSRIVITTRIESVARECGASFIHTMKPLSEADSIKLFFNRIFGSEDACPAELMKPSCEIVKKCGGLPLAIVTMASILDGQPTRLVGQWEYIQKSLATEFGTHSSYKDMMDILDLSYKDLPRQLKSCFLYLGSYPEDYEISRVDLVRRWVAEGFVSNYGGQDVWSNYGQDVWSKYGGQDVWVVAEHYFNELVNKNLIQPTYKKNITGIFGCRVNKILLELIMWRCKESKFLSSVIDSEEVEKEQDKVIRRLNVVGLGRGIKDDTMSRNLSQIRSLTILGEFNWIPPLLEFKFLRVLAVQNHWFGIKMDLTGISRLPLLRYLKVEGKVKLPCEIRGLRYLETLDISEIVETDDITLQIADVPRLSHLAVPLQMRLSEGITREVKSLRTLRGFCLAEDSLKSIIGLAELTALSDLGFYCPEGCAGLPKAAWMAPMSTSLGQLSKLRRLDMSCGEVAWCGDVLTSLSPHFYNLECLGMSGITFSRVPRWIDGLTNLHMLSLGVKQMHQEGVAIIGSMRHLLRLTLRITSVLTEKIMIGGSMGFRVLRYFQFDCDRILYLTFEAGAMEELQELELLFDPDKWDKAAPGGLQHLPSLKKIEAQIVFYAGAEFKHNHEEAALIRGVFQEAVDPLHTHPAFIFKDQARVVRPREEAEVKHIVEKQGWCTDDEVRPLYPSEDIRVLDV